MRNIKNMWTLLPLLALMVLVLPLTTSCSDEPDSEYFYTFTGKMMSDYLKEDPQYSDFATIVTRGKSEANGANLMDLLASYGNYTCFLPNNEAIAAYLQKRGLTSVDQLSDADCDTIARTHLVTDLYSTLQMTGNRLTKPNMMGRYLSTKIDTLTSDILIESNSKLIPGEVNDSVENGIVHHIDRVIEQSNSYVSDMLKEDSRISIFYTALAATKVNEEIMSLVDTTYHAENYERYYYKSHTWKEVGWVPEKREIGYTAFVEPNEVYEKKFQELGISTANGILRALYDLAVTIYDPIYGSGSTNRDDLKDGWKFENLTDSINPLKRFVRYHFLTRALGGSDDLTALEVNLSQTKGVLGFDEKNINPIEWYQTLLPHTMIKVEKLTVDKWLGQGTKGQHYLNRRYDDKFQHEGVHVINSLDDTTSVAHNALNGYYFFVEDIVAFSQTVRDEVQNMRMRMDFSAIFPEIMTNKLRQKGIPTEDDDNNVPDEDATPKNGKNYWFPEGYLDGVSFSNTSRLVMRRPHVNFWSWQGDEWNIFGDYDLTFRIPPVPKSGMYQLRLGFCAIETRGVMQVYFGSDPNNLTAQGIPLDMRLYLDNDYYIGTRFTTDESAANYDKMSDDDKAAEQKLLKNLGAYRSPRSLYHCDKTGKKYWFVGNNRTYRRILCQARIDDDKDYYLRFRVASKAKQGNDNEFMLDYLEIVPSSVYSVDGDGAMEDDL